MTQDEGTPLLHVFAADDTLLTYSLLPDPDPLRPGRRDASLTLVVTNGSRELVTVSSIAVTLPVGTSAKALTASATGIGTRLPDGWVAPREGGIVTLTPSPAAAKLGEHALTVVITGIVVNDEPGTCRITIHETASSPSKPTPEPRTHGIDLTKYPESFWLGEPRLSTPTIRRGGSVVVAWTGSPATYTLEYDPDGGGTPTRIENAKSPYLATNLSALPSVVFTLTASITLPGHDQPITAQRQATVTVGAATVTFDAFPLHVAPNGLVKLSWECIGTASRTLTPGDRAVPPVGYAYVPVPNDQTLSLIAIERETNRRIIRTVSIRVDPFAPTQTIEKRGKPGGPGTRGDRDKGTINGGNGENGESIADFTVEIGPIDPHWPPRRLLRIATKGGDGGPGGDGVMAAKTWYGNGGRGGAGGSGGTATLRFNPDKPPQQLVLDLEPSRGGPGGLNAFRQTPAERGPDGPPTVLVFVSEPSA